jgi:tryptophanyl-tRNA synthetase
VRGCGQSKKETAEIVNQALAPIRARRAEIAADPTYVEKVLADGAEKARDVAEETMRLVRKAMRLTL